MAATRVALKLGKGLGETLFTKSTWLNILIIYMSSIAINYRNRLCDVNNKCKRKEFGYVSSIISLVIALVYIMIIWGYNTVKS